MFIERQYACGKCTKKTLSTHTRIIYVCCRTKTTGDRFDSACRPFYSKHRFALQDLSFSNNLCHIQRHCAIWFKSWWRHQMETFSALLAICAGNSPVSVNSPHKGHWRGTLMFSLISAWINDWVNIRAAGDLRRNRTHCDVIVILHWNQENNINRVTLATITLLWNKKWTRWRH